jgi:tetratricopeptide (TPR) repeat protein
MGLIGTGLLVGFMVTFIIVALRQLRHFGLKFSRGHRSREGELYAAVFVTCAALLMHSLIDWDWEMPVVMLSFFMFAGALLRYGILARSAGGEAQDAGAGVPAPATAAVASGFRANWWVWLLGAGCIVMMVLTVLPVIAESRTKSAQEHLNQAQALVASNMKRDGQAWFEEAHKISSNARKYNALDARFLVQTGDANIGLAGIATDEATRISYYESAEEDYLEALKLQPDNFETYQRLAELYLRTSRLEKAADAVRRARELNPLDQIKTPSLEERVRVISVN